jgi:hypothetical protein
VQAVMPNISITINQLKRQSVPVEYQFALRRMVKIRIRWCGSDLMVPGQFLNTHLFLIQINALIHNTPYKEYPPTRVEQDIHTWVLHR